MARVVFVSSIFDQFTNGLKDLDLPETGSVFQLVRGLDRQFPGLGHFVETRASVAVNGETVQDWTSRVPEDSEILLFPRIAGGQG